SEENVVLTASFKALEQTLSFDVNGGDASSKPADMKVKTDASVDITKISVPTRTGYNFKHWYVKGDTAKTAVGASMTMPAKAVTLVAEWEVNTYSIKYDANGGSAAVPMADLTATYGVDIALSANTYTRDGYLFKGWALKADATTAAYQDKASVKNLSSAKDGQVTLYAVWAKDFTAIEAKDSTIYVGDSWTAADNFVSAADSDGNKVEFKDVTVAGIVDTTQTGDYVITYSYGGQSARATVKVLANQSTIDAKDSTIYTGWEWTAEDNFVSATDKTGAVVDFKDVTVTGTVDTEKVGDYTVTYRYGGKEVTVTVHVLENKISVKGKKSEIFVGDTWTAADNFVSATDETGAAVDFADVQVKGTVDTSKAGKYYVSYTHTRNHVVRISGITVTVLENQTSIEAKDSTIYVGDTWSAEDNFVKATDKKGTNVDFKEVTVSGTVDTTQVGDYDITYSYGGKDNKVTVHVLADQTSVEVKDIELYEGENWNAKDNFVSATDKTGAALKFDQVTVTDAEKVDTTKVGVYEVIYTNGSLSKTAKVTVKPDQREVQVQHTTLTVGDDWHPKNNFVSAKDHDGNDLAFEDLETEGSVDTSKAGIYKVTYNYSKKPIKKQRETKDAPEKGTAVAEITVVEKANDGDKTPPPSDDNGPKDDNKPNDVSGLNGNNKPDNLNKPNDSGTNQSGQNYTGNNSKPAAARTSTKSSTLPKAGENDKLIVPALGGALLLAAGLIATVLRRKKR
ncbi:MAG: bacterial Ig-like domain-containing protein, partial [Streptococcaceae bacterium]|nr:bacterial Ig-like domain-containing protein [Streptococcaceae bacterium]